MSDPVRLSNFTWIAEGLLAVGDVPSTDAEMNWLLSQGFESVVSLGESSGALDSIRKLGILYTRQIGEIEQGDRADKEMMEFLASNFLYQIPVYIFSTDVSEAFAVGMRFLEQKDLYIAKYLAKRANDLNHGDQFDWERGHDAFSGNGIYLAVAALTRALANEKQDTRFLAADTLVELMEHADHGCFPKSVAQALKKLLAEVQEIVFSCNPEYRNAYEEIFRQFEKLS